MPTSPVLSANMDQTHRVRIAITGGGIAGATLLHALLPHKHLDVHIFESAPAFKEAGAGIGISSNAFTALELIDSATLGCLERAGAYELDGFMIRMAIGEPGRLVPGAGEKGLRSVCRADFLRELLVDASENQMHTSKKLERVERTSGGAITLYL